MLYTGATKQGLWVTKFYIEFYMCLTIIADNRTFSYDILQNHILSVQLVSVPLQVPSI